MNDILQSPQCTAINQPHYVMTAKIEITYIICVSRIKCLVSICFDIIIMTRVKLYIFLGNVVNCNTSVMFVP